MIKTKRVTGLGRPLRTGVKVPKVRTKILSWALEVSTGKSLLSQSVLSGEIVEHDIEN